MGDNKQTGTTQPTEQSGEQSSGGGGFMGGIGDKLNSAAGGGKESEKNEDYLDKGKYMQHLFLGPVIVSLSLNFLQASTWSSNMVLERAIKATNLPLNRQRMSRSPILSVGSIRARPGRISPLRTKSVEQS